MIIKTTKPIAQPEEVEIEFLGAYRENDYKTLFFTKDECVSVHNWGESYNIGYTKKPGEYSFKADKLTRIEADEFLQEYEKALSQIEPVIFSMMPGGFLPNVSKGTFSLPEIPRTGENDFINNLEKDM